MINNLFSIFDPSSSNNFRLNWGSYILGLFFINFIFWCAPSRIQTAINFLQSYILKELSNNISSHNLKTVFFFIGIFIIIIINNLLGLYPYIFTATSHLVVTLTLALPFWLGYIIFGWVNLANHIFTHLVPLGTPMNLSFFIVIIETVRNIIRPLTLSVRLAANIVAGHLLISLLRGLREARPLIFLPSRVVLLLLIFLEYAVALIQRYVFITLLSLYISEIN